MKGFIKSYIVAAKFSGSSVLAVEGVMGAFNHISTWGKKVPSFEGFANFALTNNTYSLTVRRGNCENSAATRPAQASDGSSNTDGLLLSNDAVRSMIAADLKGDKILKSKAFLDAALVAERSSYEHTSTKESRYA